MAILKHIAVKNADYGEAQRYLIFKHDEKTEFHQDFSNFRFCIISSNSAAPALKAYNQAHALFHARKHFLINVSAISTTSGVQNSAPL